MQITELSVLKDNLPIMLTFTFYFFIVIVAIQFFYYLVVFGKFAYAKTQKNSLKKIPISIIVCAKNEEENVKKFIPILAEQDYPDYEIILIDDASSDETLEIFEAFEKQYSNIRLVKVKNNEAFWGNKKFALTLGIKAAKKEYLLFTDADCYPTSKDWIMEMSSHFTMNKTIILGYGAYEKIAGSFLNNEMTIYPEVFSKNNSANINVTMNKGLRIIPTNFILDNFNGAKIVNGKYVCRDEVDKHSISSQ